jgi:hypothetical protein
MFSPLSHLVADTTKLLQKNEIKKMSAPQKIQLLIFEPFIFYPSISIA